MNSSEKSFKVLIPIASCLLFSVVSIAQQQKKNLLFIITDQQRYDALSIAGNDILETPNLDQLAKEGAFFKNAYTPAAVCAPARSSILTGKTVENTGMNNNEKAYYYEEDGLMDSATFDEILSKQGYHCEYYGKWHSQSSHTEIYKNPKQIASNGKSMFAHGGQNFMYRDYLNKVYPKREPQKGELIDAFTKRPYTPDPLDVNYGKTYAQVLKENQNHIQPDFHGKSTIPKEHTITAYYAKKTIEAIERLKKKPFSITCSFHFPHAPMIPSQPYYGMYPAQAMKVPISIHDDMKNSPYANTNGRKKFPQFADDEKIKYMISNYYALIKELDDWIGKIMDKLDETGLTDETLVIFTSDHGEMLGAHGMREKNVFYEESSHVPLIINFPNEIKSEKPIEGYVSNVDLFATIMDYLKIEKYNSDGKSLRGLIERTDSEHGKYVVTEWDYRGDVSPNYMIVKDGWKMLIPKTASSKVIDALYNLNEDPYEMNNLIGHNPNRHEYASKVEELRKDISAWLKKNGSENRKGVQQRAIIKD